jgi:mannose-6-phosphate isomerase-like protein (cupin superfamily)
VAERSGDTAFSALLLTGCSPQISTKSGVALRFHATLHFMDVTNLQTVLSFVTKDGSEIRELLAHRNSIIRNQSLAEARLAPGASTQEHYHIRTEEIYYITDGIGRMRIGCESREVKVGDAIAIPPGERHKLWNTGTEVLRLLCCCAPAYEHSDTVITEE